LILGQPLDVARTANRLQEGHGFQLVRVTM
jgi:hypothetical protein